MFKTFQHCHADMYLPSKNGWIEMSHKQRGKREGLDGKTATLMSQQVQKEELAVNVPYLTQFFP